MRARVDACIRIRCRDTLPKLVEKMRRSLSFPNPEYHDRLRLGLPVGTLPRHLCFLEETGDEISLPRGTVHQLRELATANGIAVEFEDQRVLPSEKLASLHALSLRDYQALAVKKLIHVTQGLVIIPCGGGKTRVGIGAIQALGTPTLVLVHTLDLAEQWRDEMRNLLDVEAGVIGGGEDVSRHVTIALVQALSKWGDKKLNDFLGRFGFLILDEAHHVAASTFREIVGRCPAKYRLGLTATPEREDGLTPLLEMYFDKPLVVIDHEELAAAGLLELPRIRIIETDFYYPYTGIDDYAPMLDSLVSDKVRNSLICEEVKQETHAGNSCLVLSGRIEHCEILHHRLVSDGVSVALLTGKTRKNLRKDFLDKMRAGQIKVLIATTLADEGLDLPNLSRVFLAYPGRARGRTMQRLGRLMRPFPDKERPMLFDFVDRKVPVLRRQHLERRRLYAEVLGVRPSDIPSQKDGRTPRFEQCRT